MPFPSEPDLIRSAHKPQFPAVPASVPGLQPALEPATQSEPESVPDDSAGSPAEAEPAAAAEEPKAAGKNEEASEAVDTPDVITKPEAEEYDPFAPSTEPIRLTLDPLIGKTEETDSSVSGEEKG